jgi:hypothetical protein
MEDETFWREQVYKATTKEAQLLAFGAYAGAALTEATGAGGWVMDERYLPPVPWPRAQVAVLRLTEMAADLAALRQDNERLRNERNPRNETVRNLRECMEQLRRLNRELDECRLHEQDLEQRLRRAKTETDGWSEENARLRSEVDRLKAIIENVCLAIEVDAKPRSHLEEPIEALELSVRSENCLKHKSREMIDIEIKTIGDLVKLTEKALLRIPDMGRKSVKEVKEALAARGLHLAEPPAL